MRKLLLVVLAALVVGLAGAPGDTKAPPYRIEFDPDRDVSKQEADKDGSKKLLVRVKFAITLDGDKVDRVGDDYKLVIEELGKPVKTVEVPRPAPADDLSIMLAIDTSGSMNEHGRMPQARAAAETFLSKLAPAADCGLILFDHEIRLQEAPQQAREPLMQQIRTVEPRGGTAYLDAAAAGVEALTSAPAGRERAVVLLTDGIDLNSTQTLPDVVAAAIKAKVRIYTVGIGEPGRLDKVSTALVLDHSGSMKDRADDADTIPKIDALHEAAARFVGSMSSVGRVSLIPFSTGVGDPRPFSNNKYELTARLRKLVPDGETALFDAIDTAVAVLETDDATGKRAVVAMTDGVDNSSRLRVGDVIEHAQSAKIPLYLLGFGRPGQLDSEVMERMAKETGGKFFHARNKKSLIEIFENLSIALHDEGIDEASLTQLARHTGGEYYPAKDVADLKLILERVSKSIQRARYEVTFESLNQRRDGSARDIALKLVRVDAAGTVHEVQTKRTRYQTGGLVVAEMNQFVYLGMLAALAVLIALPALVRRGRAA